MQQSIEDRLISLIQSPEDLSEIILLGVTSDSFIIRKEVFEFISKYNHKYNNVPSKEILEANFPEFKKLEDISKDEKKYLSEELLKSEAQKKAIRIINSGTDLLANDPYGSIDFLISKLSAIRKVVGYAKSYTDKDSENRAKELLERKEKIAKGLTTGIKTGFSIFDKKFLGWQLGNLVAIIARLGMGKSWICEYSACSAYYFDNRRVAFLSPEMAKPEIETRWDTIMSRFLEYNFSHTELTQGKVDIEKYKEYLEKVAERKDWLTMTSDKGKPFTLSAIESIVDDFQPDLLVLDGFLHLRSMNGSAEKSWEVMLDLANGLKAIAQNNNIVILATSQASRQSAGMMPEIHQVYGGDSLAQACDLFISIADSEEPKTRYISVPKVRSGQTMNKRIRIDFDVDNGVIGI